MGLRRNLNKFTLPPPAPEGNTAPAGEQDVQRQMAAVRQRYQGTAQWLKAPNGQPTKLKERQWLQVRTPAFKQWFGDWGYAAHRAGDRQAAYRPCRF